MAGEGRDPLRSAWPFPKYGYRRLKASSLEIAALPNAENAGPTVWSDWYFPAAVGGGYTLTADVGTFTVTGTATALEYGRKMVAASGSVAITGTAASLEYNRRLVASSGSFTITGTDANFGSGKFLTASAGSYTISGTAAGLRAARRLAAEAGAVAVTGFDAALSTTALPTTTARDGGGNSARRAFNSGNLRLRSWAEDVEAFVRQTVEEKKAEPLKSKKAKARAADQVIELVGTGLMADIRPTEEMRAAIIQAFAPEDNSALYQQIAAAIQRQLDEQDDEDVVLLLLAA